MPKGRTRWGLGRRLLVGVGVGSACGAIAGVLCVVLFWFPGAMATYAENPHFTDPRSILLWWSLAYAVPLGGLGAVFGIMIGAISGQPRVARDR